MSRDLVAERELPIEAGGPEYAAAAIARIDAAEPEYGTSRGPSLRPQARATAARERSRRSSWSALAHRRLVLDAVDPRALARLRALLLSIARHGAEARTLIVEARRLAEAPAGHGEHVA
jgi:hypothetical protein